jgi:hypothetical protein
MEIEFEYKKIGGSIVIIIPPTHLKHLEVKEGNKGIIRDGKGKHGAFCEFWKK